MKAWLTVTEVAEYLQVGRTTAYELVRSGKIPSVRFGKAWRIPRHQLDELLAQKLERRGGVMGADEHSREDSGHREQDPSSAATRSYPASGPE